MKDLDTIREESPAFIKIYNIVIGILAIVSIILVIRSLLVEQHPIEIVTDNAIWIVFIADYVIRFVLAKDKKSFFLRNILDLVAIMPFYSVLQLFRIGRVIRIARLLRFVRLFRAGARIARFFKISKRFLNTNGFKFVVIATVGMIIASAILMVIVEDMPFPDGLWWSFVTVTTVGYGDIAPVSLAGRVLAIILMLFGIGLIGALTSTVTTFFIREQKKEQNEFVAAAISKLEDFDSLSKSDVEEIARVLISLKED